MPDHISLRELLVRIRFAIDLHVNLRPVETLPESSHRSAGGAEIAFDVCD